jgi:hypothetical protein
MESITARMARQECFMMENERKTIIRRRLEMSGIMWEQCKRLSKERNVKISINENGYQLVNGGITHTFKHVYDVFILLQMGEWDDE